MTPPPLTAIEILSLMARYPMFSRHDIVGIMERVGPRRCDLEAELQRLARTARH